MHTKIRYKVMTFLLTTSMIIYTQAAKLIKIAFKLFLE